MKYLLVFLTLILITQSQVDQCIYAGGQVISADSVLICSLSP
jgi:hypothetical protein